MKNAKTTLGGLAGGIALIAGGIEALTKGSTELGVSMIGGGLAMIWSMYHAQDAKKDE